MTGLRFVIRPVSALCIVLSSVFVAHAEEPRRVQPWALGVSAEHQQQADALFNQGVDFHERLLFDQALTRYREALMRWDHPAYHWNAYLALTRMGRYLDAYHELEAAMKWGPAGFERANWQKMDEHRHALIAQHLAIIEVRCDEPDAAIMLDDNPWFVGPGIERRVVVPGEHLITAKKPGYFTVVKPITVLVTRQGTMTVIMDRDRTYEKRRWNRGPWNMYGIGAGMTLVGGILTWRAYNDFDTANRTFAPTCSRICEPRVSWTYRRARWERGLALGAVIAGGLTVATGTILAILNRPRSFRTKDRDRTHFEVGPMVLDRGAGVLGRLRF